MGLSPVEIILGKKQGFIEAAAALSAEENTFIKLKSYEKAARADAEKNVIIKNLITLDRELLTVSKSDTEISENAKQIIKNINSSLNDLIKLEKENEVLISQAGESISGKYIDSYKIYKKLK